MAYEYALVHLRFTIPLASILTVVAYPILNWVHFSQVSILIAIAFAATLPWDAYLIRHHVWTYPPEAVIGLKVWGIPVEELFFFVIQTYITSLIYILVNKPILQVQYLWSQQNPPLRTRRIKFAGQAILVALIVYGSHLIQVGEKGTYLGLILVWAPPFAFITWTLAGIFIISLPVVGTVLPVLLPTIYLWLVDEFALGRGTWSIESGTKLGWTLFGSLEIEEAAFFLATNTLIVFGHAAFDQYLGVIYAFPDLFPKIPSVPGPHLLGQSRMVDKSKYDLARIEGIREAVQRLKKKSRSFYLASAAFTGRLRIDLILLYSFCRMADDLVDDAKSDAEVKLWTSRLIGFLNLHYRTDSPKDCSSRTEKEEFRSVMNAYIDENFPEYARSALRYLPVDILPPAPLYGLIDGFRMDAHFSNSVDDKKFPISDEDALREYGRCVAGTVGQLCVSLIAHHCGPTNAGLLAHLNHAANEMGIALQYVNIARDVEVDARIGRVYLPTTWLKEEGLAPQSVLDNPQGAAMERLRRRLLSKAFLLHADSRPAMQRLPRAARGPMIVAVENYMEIGRVLWESKDWRIKEGKATVPAGRRIVTALKALLGGL